MLAFTDRQEPTLPRRSTLNRDNVDLCAVGTIELLPKYRRPDRRNVAPDGLSAGDVLRPVPHETFEGWSDDSGVQRRFNIVEEGLRFTPNDSPLSDGAQSLTIDQFTELMRQLRRVAEAVDRQITGSPVGVA